MKNTLLVIFLVLYSGFMFSGCGWVANPRSKLATETSKQTKILERIAVALESHVNHR